MANDTRLKQIPQNSNWQYNWKDPINWKRVIGPYNYQNINPLLPRCGIDIRQVMPEKDQQGRSEHWDEAECRYIDYIRADFKYGDKYPCKSLDENDRLIVGLFALQRPLLLGTARKLFGESINYPTTYQLFAVGHALFNPPFPFWGPNAWSYVIFQAEEQAIKLSIVEELIVLGV